MTDLEMTKLCADAMGLNLLPAYRKGTILYDEGQHDWNGLMYGKDRGQEYLFTQGGAYGPLHDDEQAMALMKRFGLVCDPQHNGQDFAADPGWEVSHPSLPRDYLAISPSLNRAIVECVAKMQSMP